MTSEQPSAPEPSDEVIRQTTPQERSRAFRILFICLLTLGMGQTLVFAVLPPIAREFHMSEFETTMIFSLSAALWVMTSAFWGRRSDIIGRKPIILSGLFGFAISTGLFALVVLGGLMGLVSLGLMFPLLMGTRAIFGMFGSGSMPASQAYVADRTTRQERAGGVAQIGAAFGMGMVIGPGVAAVFAEIHILAPFFVVSALAFASAIGIWIFLPERSPPKQKLSEKKKTSLSVFSPTVWPWLAVGILLALCQSILMQLIAFYFMDELHIDGELATQQISVGMMAMALATLFAQLAIIQRFDLSVKFMLRWGCAAMIVSYTMLVIGGSYGMLVTGLTLAGFALGLLRPGLQAGASLSVSPKDQGAIAGFISSTAATGHIINPFVGIPLYHYMHTAPFILAAGLIVLVLLFALFHPLATKLTEQHETEEEEELHPY